MKTVVVTEEWTTTVPKIIVVEFMSEYGVISFVSPKVPMPGLQTESPIVINFDKMYQPDIVEPLARQIAMKIHEQNKGIEMIAGGTSPILAFKVASILRLPLVLVENEKLPVDISGLKIALVTDIIMTGRNTSQTLNFIKNKGGKCKDVYSVFDYDFNLSAKGLRVVKLHSILQLEDLKDLEPISNWKINFSYLFGNENRKLNVFPLAEK